VCAAIGAGTSETVRVENPWAGPAVEVVDAGAATPSSPTTDRIAVRSGTAPPTWYSDRPADHPDALRRGHRYAATAAKHLGRVQLGLDPTADPTGTATVGTVLGSTSPSYGLTLLDPAGSIAGVVGGLTARTAGDGGGLGFDVADAVAATSTYQGTATVSYYDTAPAHCPRLRRRTDRPATTRPAACRYRAPTRGARRPSRSRRIPRRLSPGGGDLRIVATGGAVAVHSVALKITGPWVAGGTLFPPAPAITSPRAAAGQAGRPFPSHPDGRVAVQESGSPLCTATADHTGAGPARSTAA